MSQAEIGNLMVRLGIDTAAFANGLKQAQSSLAGLQKSFSTLGAAFAGMLGGLGIGALGAAVTDAIKQIAQIGDLAETIGITAEQVQVFNRMALASGTSAEVMAKGLQEIAEQSTDVNSKLSKLFAANGLTAQGRDTNAVIRDFMDLLRNAKTPADQLAMATGVLGTRVGRELVEAFRTGAEGVDTATQEMVASGVYHSNEEVARLQEIEEAYNRTTANIATMWQRMVVGMVEAASLHVQGIQEMFANLSSDKPSAIQELWAMLNGDQYRGKPVVNMGPMGGAGQFAFPSLKPTTNPFANVPVLKPEKGKKERQSTIEDIYGAGKAVSALEEHLKSATPEASLFSDSLLRIGDTIQYGLSDAISGLITGTMSAKEAFAQMAQSIIQSLADIAAEMAANSLIRMFLGGLTGGGGAGINIGGMVFGGLFANGGYLGSGKWGIAGEAGPEIIHGPARITPMDRMGGGEMAVTVNNYAGAQVSTRRGMNGGLEIDIVKAEIAKDLARGGNPIAQAVERGYGLRRAGR
jgi:hypothetical protein